MSGCANVLGESVSFIGNNGKTELIGNLRLSANCFSWLRKIISIGVQGCQVDIFEAKTESVLKQSLATLPEFIQLNCLENIAKISDFSGFYIFHILHISLFVHIAYSIHTYKHTYIEPI